MSLWTFILVFCTCCALSGHRWTAILILTDCSPSSCTNQLLFTTSSTFAQHLLISKSFFFLYIYSILSLLLILMLLFISGNIHPNPGSIDSCSICTHGVTWGYRSVQCVNHSLWVHHSCTGLSFSEFQKISPGHSWTCPKCPYPS